MILGDPDADSCTGSIYLLLDPSASDHSLGFVQGRRGKCRKYENISINLT